MKLKTFIDKILNSTDAQRIEFDIGIDSHLEIIDYKILEVGGIRQESPNRIKFTVEKK